MAKKKVAKKKKAAPALAGGEMSGSGTLIRIGEMAGRATFAKGQAKADAKADAFNRKGKTPASMASGPITTL